VTLEKRGAQLRVVMALIIDEKVKTFQGLLRGIIMEKPIKKMIPGYPFRSLFYLPEIKKVIGELTMEQEAMVAHRKKAVKKALPILKKIFNLNLRS